MNHSFQKGGQVIFYQDTRTDLMNGTSRDMKRYLKEGTILTVTSIHRNTIRCKDYATRAYNYHADDLRLANDNRTEDEKYLDNLLKGGTGA